MRILGLDPGLRVTGYGVIDKSGSTLTYVSSGCIKSPDGELPDRLKNILNSVQEVISLHAPQEVVQGNDQVGTGSQAAGDPDDAGQIVELGAWCNQCDRDVGVTAAEFPHCG